jgi:hypothetical protein
MLLGITPALALKVISPYPICEGGTDLSLCINVINGTIINNNYTNIYSTANASFNQSLTDTLYYSISNPYNFINQSNMSSMIGNSSIARTGDCPDGYVVMNTTTSGVECVVVTSSWVGTATSSLLPDTDITYDIGDPSYRFNNIYGQYFYGDGYNLKNLIVNAIIQPGFGGVVYMDNGGHLIDGTVITVSGGTTADGTYGYAGAFYNNNPTWIQTGGGGRIIWYDPGTGNYFISAIAGNMSGEYWSNPGSNILGTYTPQGTATGNPIVSAPTYSYGGWVGTATSDLTMTGYDIIFGANGDVITDGSQTSIDPYNRQLYGSDGTTVRIDWSGTYNYSYPISFQGNDLILSASDGTPAFSIGAYGNEIQVWKTMHLDSANIAFDSSSVISDGTYTSIDPYNRFLYDSTGTYEMIDYSGAGYNSNAEILFWAGGGVLVPNGLMDNSLTDSIDVTGRTLKDISGSSSISYGTGNAIQFNQYSSDGFLKISSTNIEIESFGVSDTYDDGSDTQITFTNGLATTISTAYDDSLMKNITYLGSNYQTELTPIIFYWNVQGLKQYPKTSNKTGLQQAYKSSDVEQFFPDCVITEKLKQIEYKNVTKTVLDRYNITNVTDKNITTQIRSPIYKNVTQEVQKQITTNTTVKTYNRNCVNMMILEDKTNQIQKIRNCVNTSIDYKAYKDCVLK